MKYIIIIILFFFTIKNQFLPSRTKIIDHQNKNYLLRGNLPIQNHTFQFQSLINNIQSITKIKSKNIQLKVYTFMNHITQKQSKNLNIQHQFFKNHPHYAAFQNHKLLGFFFPPQSVPSFLYHWISKYYQTISYDKLDSLLTKIHNELQSQEYNVIYVHCSAGIDRTGLFSGAYKLKYKNKSLSEIYEQNYSIGGRHQFRNTLYGLLWYCNYLKVNENKKLDCELDVKKYNKKQEEL